MEGKVFDWLGGIASSSSISIRTGCRSSLQSLGFSNYMTRHYRRWMHGWDNRRWSRDREGRRLCRASGKVRLPHMACLSIKPFRCESSFHLLLFSLHLVISAIERSFLSLTSVQYPHAQHNVDSKDNYGRTPLLWASRSGHEAVV